MIFNHFIFAKYQIYFSAFPKSPFERELQRLLNESAKNKIMPTHAATNKTNNLDSTKKKHSNNNNNNNNGNGLYSKSKVTNAGSLPSSSSGNGNNNNNNIKTKDSDDSCVDTNSLKHPVGLEAIKEMTRNKNTDNQT